MSISVYNFNVKLITGLYVGSSMVFSVILLFLFLSSEVLSLSNSRDDFCKNYDWETVEKLVEPYLDDASYTALVMQGLSSKYNTSVAANQAIHPQLPQEIYSILRHIIKMNCP